MRYAYFPGCTLGSSGSDYHLSFTYVARVLGIELIEVRDWVCCGATVAFSTSRLMSLALPALNLSHAETDGFHKLIAPCPACLSRFKAVRWELEHDPETRSKMDQILDGAYQGTVTVHHPLEVFLDIGLERIRDKVKKKLSGLKIACYYGCLLTRPPKTAQFDRTENPQSLDALVKALGAHPVEWAFKTECCGAAMTLTRSDIVHKLSNDILREAKGAGADALAVACPLCQMNLDGRQRQIEEIYGVRYQLPVLYFTQWMALAFGAFPQEVGIQRVMTSPLEVLGPLGLQ
jgi:heterodisulfide reductase subunit B